MQGAEALYPDFTPFVTKFGDNLRRGYTELTPDASEQAMRVALQPYL